MKARDVLLVLAGGIAALGIAGIVILAVDAVTSDGESGATPAAQPAPTTAPAQTTKPTASPNFEWTDELVGQRLTECIGADESDTIEGECRCVIESLRADRGDEDAAALTDDLTEAQWFALRVPYERLCAGRE